MKKMTMLLLIGLMMILALGACDGATDVSGIILAAAGSSRLDTDYADALSVQGQLALGTIQLDDTNLAVDDTLAAELLPLWRALLNLSEVDSNATAEISAIISQIEDAMNAKQIRAIAAMRLTSENLSTMIVSGELQLEHLGSAANAGEGGFSTPSGAWEGSTPVEALALAGNSEDGATAGQTIQESDYASRSPESALVTATVKLLKEKISCCPAQSKGS